VHSGERAVAQGGIAQSDDNGTGDAQKPDYLFHTVYYAGTTALVSPQICTYKR
jgi:hypothetical protein